MIKSCSYCHQVKPVTEFHKTLGRFSSYCKPCRKIMDREARLKKKAKREAALAQAQHAQTQDSSLPVGQVS